MARVVYVKKAQQRYKTVPVIDPETGKQKVTPVKKKDGTPKVTKTGREVVRRITMEDKTQPLPPNNCEKCHKPIEVGTPYKWVAPKSGPYGGVKRFRHAGCPSWTRGELTSSKMGAIWDAQDTFDPGDTVDSINEALSDFAQIVRDVAAEYNDSADNIEEGFGHATYQSDELRERADNLESWADDLEGGIDEVTIEPCDDHQDTEGENVASPDYSGEVEECSACQELYDTAVEEMQNAAQDKIGEEP